MIYYIEEDQSIRKDRPGQHTLPKPWNFQYNRWENQPSRAHLIQKKYFSDETRLFSREGV